MEPNTIRHYSSLFLAALGQTVLFTFAWAFFGIVWLYGPLALPPGLVSLLKKWPSELTTIITLIGTVLSLMSTWFFTVAFKEALRHRMHKPISLIELEGGIALARGDYFLTRNSRITLATLAMFWLANIMTSCWTTLLTPTLNSKRYTVDGTELDLRSSYFESQLHQQLLASGSATLADSNSSSLKIIGTEGLLSGIAAAQLHSAFSGVVSFNEVRYYERTGGVVPVAYGYLGEKQVANPNDTGLNFVGGLVPTNMVSHNMTHVLNTNYTIWQQGLTANVTCTQVDLPGPVANQSDSVSPSNFNGSTLSLTAYSFQMACDDGTSSQQDYVIRSSNEAFPASSIGLVYSLVCPSPVNQSQQMDWIRFNVTSGCATSDKYSFLQLTTCEIVPQFTTSEVVYTDDTLWLTNVHNRTALTAGNRNLALYLASIVDYLALNAQSLTSNSFGDALYSVAANNNANLPTSGPMDPRFLKEMEQYWRGVIEFTGTYLKSGFSTTNNYTEGSIRYTGTITVTTFGWAPRSPIYLYTVLPVTLFLILTYAAIIYVLYEVAWKGRSKLTVFDPTNPLHLIMVSSTRVQPAEPGSSEVGPDEKQPVPEENLEGEKLGDFTDLGIEYNHAVSVELVDAGGFRKHFRKWTKGDFESYKADLEKRRSAASADTKSPQESA